MDKDKTGKYFYIHRVRLNNEASTRPAGGMCFTDRTKLLAGGAPMEIPKTDAPIGKVTTDEDNTLSADRPIMECPVQQTPVKNGAPERRTARKNHQMRQRRKTRLERFRRRSDG